MFYRRRGLSAVFSADVDVSSKIKISTFAFEFDNGAECFIGELLLVLLDFSFTNASRTNEIGTTAAAVCGRFVVPTFVDVVVVVLFIDDFFDDDGDVTDDDEFVEINELSSCQAFSSCKIDSRDLELSDVADKSNSVARSSVSVIDSRCSGVVER